MEDTLQYRIPGAFPIEEDESLGEDEMPVQTDPQPILLKPGIIGCHILAEDTKDAAALIE